ncbi:hypothetical protein D3C77_467720 [compost metagenome]
MERNTAPPTCSRELPRSFMNKGINIVLIAFGIETINPNTMKAIKYLLCTTRKISDDFSQGVFVVLRIDGSVSVVPIASISIMLNSKEIPLCPT